MHKNTAALLRCENLSAGYEGRLAVRDVSFSLHEGESLCIIGSNGSGKSTLLKVVLGLLPPAAGKVEYPALSRSQIGYLPQQTPVQRDFPASVFEVVRSGCQSRAKGPFYSKSDEARARDCANKLGITPLLKKSYRQLSGGQQQRVLLARALCAAQRLLVLDEPVAGLDADVTAQLYALIQQLNEQEGMAILMVSHDIEAALRSAHTVLELDTSVAYYGPAEDYARCECGVPLSGGAHAHA